MSIGSSRANISPQQAAFMQALANSSSANVPQGGAVAPPSSDVQQAALLQALVNAKQTTSQNTMAKTSKAQTPSSADTDDDKPVLKPGQKEVTIHPTFGDSKKGRFLKRMLGIMGASALVVAPFMKATGMSRMLAKPMRNFWLSLNEGATLRASTLAAEGVLEGNKAVVTPALKKELHREGWYMNLTKKQALGLMDGDYKLPRLMGEMSVISLLSAPLIALSIPFWRRGDDTAAKRIEKEKGITLHPTEYANLYIKDAPKKQGNKKS